MGAAVYVLAIGLGCAVLVGLVLEFRAQHGRLPSAQAFAAVLAAGALFAVLLSAVLAGVHAVRR